MYKLTEGWGPKCGSDEDDEGSKTKKNNNEKKGRTGKRG